MKPLQNTCYILLFCCLIASCNNQNQSNESLQTIQIQKETPSFASKVDSSLLLKFTTGIRSILEDSKGNIWFGSHQEGVCLFDGEKLTYFTEQDGLSDRQVRSIFEDEMGQIWFECGRGISSYNGQIISHPKKNYNVKNKWQSSPKDLWFKGDETVSYNALEISAGVYRYDGIGLTYHVFPFSPKKNNQSYYSVSTPFVRAENGMLWFGTYGAAIGYDGSSFTIIDDESLGLNDETGHLHIRSLYADNKGNLWIGNNGIGVLLYDGDSTINFSKQQGLVSGKGLSAYKSPFGNLEHVFAIGEDRFGNIWFGDRDTGAWRYDGETMKNYTKQDGLSVTHIWQIYRSKRGELWLAMGDGKVLRFNGTSFDRIF